MEDIMPHGHMKRVLFTPVEDQIILKYVQENGPKRWSQITPQVPGRTGRQCRDRYMNYLAPNINHNRWNEQEDLLLIQKYAEFGPQWTILKRFFPGRTGNMLKNRWNFNLMHKYSKKKKNSQTFWKRISQNSSPYYFQKIQSHRTCSINQITPVVNISCWEPQKCTKTKPALNEYSYFNQDRMKIEKELETQKKEEGVESIDPVNSIDIVQEFEEYLKNEKDFSLMLEKEDLFNPPVK
ncbi:Myb-like DNA-binding domain containing protein [Tritrichomonas foetus]|uniref:Myb-like DNA-binding domain containing protein n=1 Tax=Tritrichomonas foetus TaxID=1144522 RepID=A0A1J4KR59_9EUKA|nr:Myb-like DNA-binding domain containing protein [Tritrichomonas foetus]|eukprot:OHT13416.1 Myb-like DNA-binding domain containing protein [Tritrichomonas foetus]